MSQENHPNFHAIKFITDITSSFFDSLRNKNLKKEDIESISQQVKDKMILFVAEVEGLVDSISGCENLREDNMKH